MDKDTISILEFDKIRTELADSCFSCEGYDLIINQDFFTDFTPLDLLLDQVGEFRLVLKEKFPQIEFPGIIDSLKVLKVSGSVLEGSVIADIAVYIKSSSKLTRFFKESETETVLLSSEINNIPDLKSLSLEIFKILNRDGTVKATHPVLNRIQNNIFHIKTEMDKISNDYIQNDKKLWQSDVPSLKDGRIVLPLKADFRGRVQGIVHEVSSSGATLFIEPVEVVERNNRLMMLEEEYKQELVKIYRKLTELIRESSAKLEKLIMIIAFLDTVYVRALYSLTHKCVRAENSKDVFCLIGARHPHLGDSSVPISININRETKIFMITGPNAGGKTVSIKTAGLFALMNQFGMEIPLEAGSLLPIFTDIRADIGDTQSIEDSLSTFSGHMKKISEILTDSSPNSLVLLDELGSGTDPQEGSALGMSILDHLLEINCISLITTHYNALKNYAHIKEGIVNASAAFDERTHLPVYKIIPGLPGESHAIEIASVSGLKESIIKKAENYLSSGRTDFSKLMKGVIEKEKILLDREKNIAVEEEKNNKNSLELDHLYKEIRKKEMIIREKENRDYSSFIGDTRKRLENLVRELKEGELTAEKTGKVKSFISELTIKESENNESLEKIKLEIQSGNTEPIGIGMDVYIKNSKDRGTVLRKGKGDQWVVTTGNLRMSLSKEDLFPVPATKADKKIGSKVTTIYSAAISAASYELDLRGKRLEEAISVLEKQIDRAVLSGMQEFSVIHGLGDGVLQKGVHNYLKSCKYISDYHFSHLETGGFGKTIVIVK